MKDFLVQRFVSCKSFPIIRMHADDWRAPTTHTTLDKEVKNASSKKTSITQEMGLQIKPKNWRNLIS